MGNLDQDMEREIDDLRRRYHAKRQPILDAMDQKRKRQQRRHDDDVVATDDAER